MLQRSNGWSAPLAATVLMGAAALVGVKPSVAATTYKVVPSQSSVTVFSKTKSPIGRLRHEREQRSNDISGSIVFAAANKPTSLSMNFKANSLKTVKKGDLDDGGVAKVNQVTRDSILEAGKYPNVTFKSTKISVKPGAGGTFTGTVLGNLTLHGKTRAISVPVSGKMTSSMVNAKGKFTIKQSDYGITIISIMGGMISAEDPVTISLNLVAKK